MLPIIDGILEETCARNIKLHLSNPPEDTKDIKNILSKHHPDGIIWITPTDELPYVMNEWAAKAHLWLVINRILTQVWANYVSTDHKRGMQEVTSYLTSKGYRRIGFIAHEKESFSAQRLDGYLAALKTVGVEPDTDLILEVPFNNPLPFLHDKLAEMLRRCKPEALVIQRGEFVPAVLEVLKEEKLVIPDDLELATYDEVPEEYEEKRYIHEVIQPFVTLGREAVCSMDKLISGEERTVKKTVPPEIRIKPGK